MTFPIYYVIQTNAPPPPAKKKKHGIFQPVQDAGGVTALAGVLMGRGGAGIAKTGGAVSDAGTEGAKVETAGDKVGGAKDKLDRINGSKVNEDVLVISGDYTVRGVAPNDVPHNLSTAELNVAQPGAAGAPATLH